MVSDGDVAESQRILAQIAGLADADSTLDAGYAAFVESCSEAEQRDERLTARQQYAAATSGMERARVLLSPNPRPGVAELARDQLSRCDQAFPSTEPITTPYL